MSSWPLCAVCPWPCGALGIALNGARHAFSPAAQLTVLSTTGTELPVAKDVPENSTTAIRWLATHSSRAWLELVMAHPEQLLIDHAHCERKAASAAIRLMFTYPTDTELSAALSPLAREELEHHELLLGLMSRRGIALRPLDAPPYGARLRTLIRSREPERLLDTLLVAGLIEARSHERMGLLARHLEDRELADLYAALLASEARHFGLYRLLAELRFSRAAVNQRLGELAQGEAAILARLHPKPRMHS